MKLKLILYVLFSILFLAVFFFNIFPVPVQVSGAKTFFNQFIFTSMLYQLKVGAYNAFIPMVALFSLPFVAIKLWK